jgi:hypothetical protein
MHSKSSKITRLRDAYGRVGKENAMALVVGSRKISFRDVPWFNDTPVSFTIDPDRYVYDDRSNLIVLFHVVEEDRVFRNFLVEANGPFPTDKDTRKALQTIAGFLVNFGTSALVSGITDTNEFFEDALGNWAGGQMESLVRGLIGDITRSDLFYFDYDNEVATICCGLTV